MPGLRSSSRARPRRPAVRSHTRRRVRLGGPGGARRAAATRVIRNCAGRDAHPRIAQASIESGPYAATCSGLELLGVLRLGLLLLHRLLLCRRVRHGRSAAALQRDRELFVFVGKLVPTARDQDGLGRARHGAASTRFVSMVPGLRHVGSRKSDRSVWFHGAQKKSRKLSARSPYPRVRRGRTGCMRRCGAAGAMVFSMRWVRRQDQSWRQYRPVPSIARCRGWRRGHRP